MGETQMWHFKFGGKIWNTRRKSHGFVREQVRLTSKSLPKLNPLNLTIISTNECNQPIDLIFFSAVKIKQLTRLIKKNWRSTVLVFAIFPGSFFRRL